MQPYSVLPTPYSLLRTPYEYKYEYEYDGTPYSLPRLLPTCSIYASD